MAASVLNYGVINASTTITLSQSCNTSNYMILLNTNAYQYVDVGPYTKTVDYGYGKGAYISSKTSSSVTITVSTGITCSYQIIKLS